MGRGDGTRACLAPIGGPARPQPVGRIDPRGIEARRDRLAFARDAAEHRVDELVVALGAWVVLGERHGEVDGRVRRRLEEDELRRGRQQDRIERAGFLRKPALEKAAEHMVELTLAPEAHRHDGAGQRAVARRQVEHGALVEGAAQDVVERLLLLQNRGEQLDGSAPCRQPDLGVARAGAGPRFLA